nr:hypothetical protein [Nitrospirota bacterium]
MALCKRSSATCSVIALPLLTIALLLISMGAPLHAQSPEDHLKQAVERAKRATVGILNATPDARQSGYDTQLSFRGTGVHLRNGYILTARHAVERQSGSNATVPDTILILTQRLEELPAKLVG